MRPADPVVLVVGATGYVGRETVLAALEHAHVKSVVAHVRPGSTGADDLRKSLDRAAESDENPGRSRVEEVELTPEAIQPFLDRVGPTHIFLCHGTTKKRAEAEGLDDPYETVDVGLTRLFVDAAALQAREAGAVGRDHAVDPRLALRQGPTSVPRPGAGLGPDAGPDAGPDPGPDPSLGPRIVYLSSMGTSKGARGAYLKARWRAERLIVASGLPHTLCRAPLLSGPDRKENRPGEIWAARLLRPALWVAGKLGMKRLAARYTPMGGAEAAEGLVRSGFHYMTINRVVMADELRREGVYEKESWTPESHRDQPRF